ncbi:MAG: twin-arginine translocase TatA/TatE family subunit [Rhodospirillaceae bacterium]
MGSFSIFHWLVVLVVIMILFGAGRLPSVMGDFAKGIKAFRAGLKDEVDAPNTSSPSTTSQVQAPMQVQAQKAAPFHTATATPSASDQSSGCKSA